MENVELLRIANNGEEIIETNFFETHEAKMGIVFLSWNAGAARLMLPKALEAQFKREIRNATEVVFTGGRYKDRDALEIMFEDNSFAPFMLLIGEEQSDFKLGRRREEFFNFHIYTQEGKLTSFKARARMVKTLPCLKPWGKE